MIGQVVYQTLTLSVVMKCKHYCVGIEQQWLYINQYCTSCNYKYCGIYYSVTISIAEYTIATSVVMKLSHLVM